MICHSFSIPFYFGKNKKAIVQGRMESLLVVRMLLPKHRQALVAALPQQWVTLLWLLPNSVDTWHFDISILLSPRVKRPMNVGNRTQTLRPKGNK